MLSLQEEEEEKEGKRGEEEVHLFFYSSYIETVRTFFCFNIP